MLCLLTGCGKGIRTVAGDRGPFEPYFQRFQQYSRAQGRSTWGDEQISIVWGELHTSESARCEWHFVSGRRILVAKARWDSLSEPAKEALILHELGHCLLRREHVLGLADPLATKGRSGIPKSLMNPGVVPGEIYEQMKEYYLEELFSRGP